MNFGGTSGNHLIVVGPSGCSGGVGTVGSGINSGGRLNFNWSPNKNLTTLLHELGHNLSLAHAHACYPAGPGCTFREYGNNYNFMGVSIVRNPPFTPANLDSFERRRLAVVDTGEIAELALPDGVREATSVHDLRARGTGAGLRGLRITDPRDGAVYVVDWRSGGARDALAYYASNLATFQDQFYNPGITVVRVEPDGESATLQAYPKPDPADGDTFGLTAGKSFTGTGVTITAESIGDQDDPLATSRIGVTLSDPSRPEPRPTPEPTPVPSPAATPDGAPVPTATPVPPEVPVAPGELLPQVEPAKLEVARATISRSARRLSLLAPITARASGTVRVALRAAGRTTTFSAPIDAARRRVLVSGAISAAQARAGTGILTITYAGDADTQPQVVRLRAASSPSALRAGRPVVRSGRVTASGRISSRARGVVRVQLLYEPAGGTTRTLGFQARIRDGRYRLDAALPADVANRRGVLHSYTLFTGDLGHRLRGELASYQVLGRP